MKYKDLKDYHAYYVMVVVFLVTCLVTRDMVFFPLACCMLCLGVVRQLKDQSRLPARNQDKAAGK